MKAKKRDSDNPKKIGTGQIGQQKTGLGKRTTPGPAPRWARKCSESNALGKGEVAEVREHTPYDGGTGRAASTVKRRRATLNRRMCPRKKGQQKMR